jgi:hypothetical protein
MVTLASAYRTPDYPSERRSNSGFAEAGTASPGWRVVACRDVKIEMGTVEHRSPVTTGRTDASEGWAVTRELDADAGKVPGGRPARAMTQRKDLWPGQLTGREMRVLNE